MGGILSGIETKSRPLESESLQERQAFLRTQEENSAAMRMLAIPKAVGNLDHPSIRIRSEAFHA